MHEIRINPEDPASIQRALNTEWLLTNGLGGYAMGTALGVNTRRYHGLLVAATKPPVGRIVALHSVIEQLVIPRDDGSEEIVDLSTQMFVGPPPEGEPILHPNGWRKLRSFRLSAEGSDFEYEIGAGRVFKGIGLFPGRNCCRCGYLVKGFAQPIKLRLRPIVLLRDFHSLMTGQKQPRVECRKNACIVELAGLRLAIEAMKSQASDDPTNMTWRIDEQWWRQFAYVQDRKRGQDWVEDAWSPGYLEAMPTQVQRQHWSIGLRALLRKPKKEDREAGHRRFGYSTPAGIAHTPLTCLKWDAHAFVVTRVAKRDASVSAIAGYPWFGDWGRDTMISLPGLMLCTGRIDDARSCLMLHAQHLRNGLIPNVFDDYGGPAHYNTADASLWFVHAVHELWKAPHPLPGPPSQGGGEEMTALIAACRAVIASYKRGTDFNIRMDRRDGLIIAGDEGSQLTWMDAKRDGVVFTPRHGKAVEINALWFNALHCLAEMSEDESERNELFALSRRVSESFRAQFWWRERGCLHDVLLPSGVEAAKQFVSDGKLRPNQVFAVSLPFSPLAENQQRAIVKIVGKRLLTPFGLRTLDRDDPDFRGRFEGNLFERDQAYHNGTVWPWLIGPYCEALLRINDFDGDTKKKVKQIIQPLLDELGNIEGGRCLGQLAEVYDGDPPQLPGGCPAQAWSVAEVLRIATLSE